MTRISDKPLAFQSLQQRRREREQARNKAVLREDRRTFHAQNLAFQNPQLRHLAPGVWPPIPGLI
ncbi:hypothetical protein [Delftia acidovorans]|uniref:Uncharacterized protein n=1 Tax=Delftia acidovorans TaxID=80866 RepID=A0AAJ2R8P1_DELAC|nr:hypothetical protein [Delftia acidovorans]MDX4957258.1 hypothetical protein [Delftia acidovorans]